MNSHPIVTGHLPDEQATLALGACFAKVTVPSIMVYLVGGLGAGKTTFVRGLLRELGYQAKVKSPTYTLLESYPLANITVHHADLYRFTDAQEWEDAGLRDNLCHRTLWLLEWPDKAAGFLPPADVTLELAMYRQGRHYRFSASTTEGQSCLNRLSTLNDVPC